MGLRCYLARNHPSLPYGNLYVPPASGQPRHTPALQPPLLLKRGRELCGFAFTHTKSKGDPWHNLITWPRDKAGMMIIGSMCKDVALCLKKAPQRPKITPLMRTIEKHDRSETTHAGNFVQEGGVQVTMEP